jgi:hypothetical protein
MTVNTLDSRSVKVLGLLAGTMIAVTLMPIDRAQAATIGNRNNLNSITGLQVGGTLYDVTFSAGNFNGAFGGASGIPQFNAAGATQAVNAINAFFNSTAIEFGDGSTGSPDDNLVGAAAKDFSYLVPYLLTGNDVSSKLGVMLSRVVSSSTPDPEWTLGGTDVAIARTTNPQSSVYASFDKARPVPTPALLPGLVGLGLSVWRKRKEEALV